MSKQLSKYVVSTIKAIGYDIKEYLTDEGDTVYALTYNGFLHSDWMMPLEIEAFAHGVSRALHYTGHDHLIAKVLDDMCKKERAEKAKKAKCCVDTTEKEHAAEGEEHHDCCGKCVEGHNEYVVLEGESAFACMFADAMSVLDELSDMMESRRRASGKDE